MNRNLEKECNALGGLFQSVISEMKTSYPAWEDFGHKAVKLSVQMKATIGALDQFLDAMQKVADFATSAKGGTRDIGTALTRICMRHRSMENRLKTMSSALVDCMVLPMQEHSDGWRQRAVSLDKEHSRGYKRCKNDIRKRVNDVVRIKKKVRKGDTRLQPMLDSAVLETNACYEPLLQHQRKMCKSALTEQRSQFCYFVSWFKPVLDLELGLLEETGSLKEVTDLLCKHSTEPNVLPPSSEAVIYDAKGLEHTWTHQFVSPPSSPSSLGSRKSSFCSLSSAEGCQYGQHRIGVNHQYIDPHRNAGRHLKQPSTSTVHQLGTSSHDSGIATSQDVIYTPTGIVSQQSTPSPSPSAFTWPVIPNSPCADDISLKDQSIGRGFCPDRPATLGLHSTTSTNEGKPPLPNKKCLVTTTPPVTPTPTTSLCTRPFRASIPTIPDFNAIHPDQIFPRTISETPSATSEQPTRTQNGQGPGSFVGDDEEITRLLKSTAMIHQQQRHVRTESYQTSFSNSGSSPIMLEHDDDDDDDDTLIDDALDRIDRMSNDLDVFCDRPAMMTTYRTLPRRGRSSNDDDDDDESIRWRRSKEFVSESCQDHCRDGHGPSAAKSLCSMTSSGRTSKLPPPPPIRHSSTTISTTSTAPSVHVFRSRSRCTTPAENTLNCRSDSYSLHIGQPHYCFQSSYHLNNNSNYSNNNNNNNTSSFHANRFNLTHQTMLMQIRNGVPLRPQPSLNGFNDSNNSTTAGWRQPHA